MPSTYEISRAKSQSRARGIEIINVTKSAKVKSESAISREESYSAARGRISAPSMFKKRKNEIWAPGRISRQIGASVSRHLYFVTLSLSRAAVRYSLSLFLSRSPVGSSGDIVAVKAVSPYISRHGCVYSSRYIFGDNQYPYRILRGLVRECIYGGTSQCIRFTCFPIPRDAVISLCRPKVSDK